MFPFIYLLISVRTCRPDLDCEDNAKKCIQLEVYTPLSSLKLPPFLESHPCGGFPSILPPYRKILHRRKREQHLHPKQFILSILIWVSVLYLTYVCVDANLSHPLLTHAHVSAWHVLWIVPGTELGLLSKVS